MKETYIPYTWDPWLDKRPMNHIKEKQTRIDKSWRRALKETYEKNPWKRPTYLIHETYRLDQRPMNHMKDLRTRLRNETEKGTTVKRRCKSCVEHWKRLMEWDYKWDWETTEKQLRNDWETKEKRRRNEGEKREKNEKGKREKGERTDREEKEENERERRKGKQR